MTKDELEAAIKTANLWSGRSTLVLAIGILGEYALLPFLEKRRWHLPVKILFAILVVAGIVGEYEFSSRISQHADELQRISDGELKDATDKAGKAIERASKADERAATFEKEAATLRKQAEDEAIARGQVALRLDPTIDRTVRFMTSLKGAPKGQAIIWFDPAEPGARDGAQFIEAVLSDKGTGWAAEAPVPIPPDRADAVRGVDVITPTRQPMGCLAVVPANSACGALVRALGALFRTGEFTVQDASLPKNTFIIVVRRSPP